MASINKISIGQSEQSHRADSSLPGLDSHDAQLLSHTIAMESLRIQFLTHSQKLHGWISSYYEPCNHADASVGTAIDYSIRLEEIGSPQALDLPQRSPGLFTKFCLIADAHCYFADGQFTSQAAGDLAHHIEVDAVVRTVHGNVGGIFLQSEESFIYVVLRDILRRLVLPLSGYLMLHGSVVTRGQQTIFFAGDKGMGKSTIALEMLKHDYKIISDDGPLASLTVGGAHVFSGRDQLSVTGSTLSLFPELGDCVSGQRDVSGKYFLDRVQLGAARLSSNAERITDFVQLKRGSYARVALNPIEKGTASANLIREFMPLFRKELLIDKQPEFFRNTNKTMFQILSQLLAGSRTYELLYCDQHRAEVPALLSALASTKS